MNGDWFDSASLQDRTHAWCRADVKIWLTKPKTHCSQQVAIINFQITVTCYRTTASSYMYNSSIESTMRFLSSAPFSRSSCKIIAEVVLNSSDSFVNLQFEFSRKKLHSWGMPFFISLSGDRLRASGKRWSSACKKGQGKDII